MAHKRWRPEKAVLWRGFGRWIKDHRERSQLKQTELAEMAGIHSVQLSRIENGTTGTTRETVASLAKALNLDTREAFNRAGFDIPALQSSSNAEMRKLLKYFDELPAKEQLTLVYFAETLWRRFGESEEAEKGGNVKQFKL